MRDALIAVALAGCAGCAQFSQSDANTAAVAIANAAGAALGNAGVSSGRSENAAAMTFGSNSYRANCALEKRSPAETITRSREWLIISFGHDGRLADF